eukprot:COSAG01_NODE_4427_length_5035_cov_2.138574_4_plen_130_part_00
MYGVCCSGYRLHGCIYFIVWCVVCVGCMAGRLAGTQVRVSAPGPLAPPLYLDNKATLYDLSPVASFVDHPTGRVRAAIIPRSTDVPTLTAHLRTAQVNHHIVFPFMFLPSLLWVCYRFCRPRLSHRWCA